MATAVTSLLIAGCRFSCTTMSIWFCRMARTGFSPLSSASAVSHMTSLACSSNCSATSRQRRPGGPIASRRSCGSARALVSRLRTEIQTTSIFRLANVWIRLRSWLRPLRVVPRWPKPPCTKARSEGATALRSRHWVNQQAEATGCGPRRHEDRQPDQQSSVLVPGSRAQGYGSG